MTSIFTHIDEDDDVLAVSAYGDYLIFLTESWESDNNGVRIRRDNAVVLHAALGEWLQRENGPLPISGAGGSVIDQLIVRRVAEEVARVLPLHLSPVAQCQAEECDGARHLGDRPAEWPDLHPKYEDARTDPDAASEDTPPERIETNPVAQLADGIRTAQEAIRGLYSAAGTPRDTTWSDKVWGVDGTPPAASAPECTSCSHPYSRHTGTRLLSCWAERCECARYRSEA